LLIAIAYQLSLIKKHETRTEQRPLQAGIIKLPDTKNSAENYYPLRNWSILEPQISALSALMINYKPGFSDIVLFSKNSQQLLPIASLTKLMTGIIALENYDLNEIIDFSKNNEKLTIQDLLYLMLIESNNDAAMSLASNNPRLNYRQFIDLMNDRAKAMGIENTTFIDPAGLSSCNQSTARGIAEITKSAMSFPLLMEIVKTPETIIASADKKFIHRITNTNKLLGKIPELIGGKTGYTDEAGGCMMTLLKIKDNNYLILVILGSSDREVDTENLINWSQKAFIW
jgi:D-alanyl-D-alanine carboxypeptidase